MIDENMGLILGRTEQYVCTLLSHEQTMSKILDAKY